MERTTNHASGTRVRALFGVTAEGDKTFQGWFDNEVTVVPREQVYPSGKSEEETQQANRQAFLTSEQAARGAALAELGYPAKVVVQDLAEDSASEGQLAPGDAVRFVPMEAGKAGERSFSFRSPP